MRAAGRGCAEMSELIRIREVYKIYHAGAGEVRALDGVNLAVDAGGFIAIIGHSGSGKSTLMNILGCLDTPTRGEYLLSGEQVSRLSDRRLSVIRNRMIGFIFQGFNLVPSLSALENVELPLFYRGMRREERHRLAVEALRRVGLGQRMDHRPSEMSGGQQQRVAIARAVAASPPLILADEPTGNLDSRSGADVLGILSDLNRDGRTVILITHDRQIAHAAARIVEIFDGKIIGDTAASGSGPDGASASVEAGGAAGSVVPLPPVRAVGPL